MSANADAHDPCRRRKTPPPPQLRWGGDEYLDMTTTISIANGGFAINGTPTYAGR